MPLIIPSFPRSLLSPPLFPGPVILARREPKDVKFNINMKAKTNSKLTNANKIDINANLTDLENFFKTIITHLCSMREDTNIGNIIIEINAAAETTTFIDQFTAYMIAGGYPLTADEFNSKFRANLAAFITTLYNRKDISKLCRLNRSVKILVGGGNSSNKIDIDLKKILSEKYDIESLNKESKFYNYNVEWMNSRKEFQNLIYKLLKPKDVDMFFDSMSKSMKLLDSVVLDNKKYCVYKHLYKLYQDKKFTNL